jgi:uncharacterized membrane protein
MSLTAYTRFSWSRWFPSALIAASLLYPGIVYLGRASVPPLAFVIAAVALIGVRLATLPLAERVWRVPLLAAAALIAALAALDAPLAVKAYPVAVSLAAATVFGTTLACPPSLIERFARWREPDLPPAAQSYCRKVTIVWTVWLIVNAIIAAVLSLPGHDEAWALWTGLVAYVVMAALFAGEIAVRRIVRGRAAKI